MTCNALKPHEVCFPLFSHRLYLTLSGIQRISPVHLGDVPALEICRGLTPFGLGTGRF